MSKPVIAKDVRVYGKVYGSGRTLAGGVEWGILEPTMVGGELNRIYIYETEDAARYIAARNRPAMPQILVSRVIPPFEVTE